MTKDIRFVVTVKDREPFYFNQAQWSAVKRIACALYYDIDNGVTVFDQLQDEFVSEDEWLHE
jgi:hypothetical protein